MRPEAPIYEITVTNSRGIRYPGSQAGDLTRQPWYAPLPGTQTQPMDWLGLARTNFKLIRIRCKGLK